VQHVLAERGAIVLLAASGHEALRLVQHVLPAAIVTDIAMPDGSGLWFMKELGNLPGGRAVPVIALSGYTAAQVHDDWKDVGFSCVVSKPVDPFELCELLAGLVAHPSRPPRRRVSPRFKIGDAVSCPSEPGWIGEIVDLSRLRNGYVTVRWRSASG